MKKFYPFFYLILTLITFFACTGDEVNQECVTCDFTATEYCINEGEDFYTIIENETSTVVQLENQFWSDIKNTIEFECGADCFVCNDSQTTYCYIEGNNFYTMRIEGLSSQVIPLENNSWNDLKEEFSDNCTDPTIDCYTCENTLTEYCYTEDADHYTATVDGNETQILLEGQSWEETKESLIFLCPGDITGNIVGNWELINCILNTTINTTIDGNVVTVTSESIGLTYNTIETFTENPNESSGEGISILLTTVTDETGGVTILNDVEFEILNSTSWEINEEQLIKVVDGETVNADLIVLTDTNLRYHVNQTITGEDNEGNPQTINLDTILTFTRL